MSISAPDLNSFSVMLSASLPEDMEQTLNAQDKYDLIVTLVGGVLTMGGMIVFGGHPSITPLIHCVARSSGIKEPCILLYQVASLKNEAPEEVKDTDVFKEVIWVGSEDGTRESLKEDLVEMRQQMVERAGAGIFVGGKTKNFIGDVPGVRDEYQRFVTKHRDGPAYLLGMLAGEAMAMIRRMEQTGDREPNTLNPEELRAIHYTDNVDLACSLILADLIRTANRQA